MTLRHLFPLWFTLYLTVLRSGTISLHICIVSFCIHSLVLSWAHLCFSYRCLSLFHTLSTSLLLIQPFVCLPEPGFQRKHTWIPSLGPVIFMFCVFLFTSSTQTDKGSSCVNTRTQTHNETSMCRIVLLLQRNGDFYSWLIILSVLLSTLTKW